MAKPAAHDPAPRGLRLKPSTSETIFAQGTNGFILGFKVVDRRTLEVTATKLALATGIGAVGATYTVPYRQPRGSDRIEARLGRLGRIDVRFIPESVRREPPILSQCHGGKALVEEGEFVGSISFHGEGGYTKVRIHHASGEISTSPELHCIFTASKSGRAEAKAETEEAEAETEAGESQAESEAVELKVTAVGRRVDFDGARIRLRSRPGHGFGLINFEATASRHRGRIFETSEAETVFDAGKSFVSPEPRYPTREAVIRPGRPFTGSATFRRAPGGSVSWTGDLSVELPGFGHVRLAGKGTHVAMCEPIDCMGK